jgi:hypothetical protein
MPSESENVKDVSTSTPTTEAPSLAADAATPATQAVDDQAGAPVATESHEPPGDPATGPATGAVATPVSRPDGDQPATPLAAASQDVVGDHSATPAQVLTPEAAAGPAAGDQEAKGDGRTGRTPSYEELVKLLTAWLKLFIEPGQVTELRALGVAKRFATEPHPEGGFYDYDHLEWMVKAALELERDAKGVYFAANPLHRDTLAMRANHCGKLKGGEGSADGHVLRRRWLLIDADPKRNLGLKVSSTDAEKLKAHEVVLRIRDHLTSQGWPAPILADSGNGYHLLYRIDLPADDGGQVRRVLEALDSRFSTNEVTVDRAVHNAARHCKFYGTFARKGDSVSERPHRLAQILEVPGAPDPYHLKDAAVESVSRDLLEALVNVAQPMAAADGMSALPPASQSGRVAGSQQHRLDVPRWLSDRGVEFKEKNHKTADGRAVYLLKACPFDSAHGGSNEVCVMQAPDGKLSARCMHNSCSGRGWKDFKAAIGEPDADHYDPPLRRKAARGGSVTTAEAEAPAPEMSLAAPTAEFQVVSGRICNCVQCPDGSIDTKPLCNFSATITHEVVHDDGAETTTYFRLAGELDDGTRLPEIDVPAGEYADMAWVTALWGARPIINPGRAVKDQLRAAIQYLSGRVAKVTVYGHTGWRRIDGQWHYLHAGGAIGPTGPAAGVQVRLPDALARFCLPLSPAGDELRQAVEASLALVQGVTSVRVAFPVYAAIWRAALGGPDLSVALNGLTGSFKSEMASLAQRHFGAGMDRTHLPANWSSTANALEGLAHAAKDVLLVVDDFCPPPGKDAARYHAKADQVMRGAGNGAGRQRMRADTSLRPEKPPRCLILSTGEDSPGGQSLQARMLQVDQHRNEVDTRKLRLCQDDAGIGLYAQVMAAFVQRLAGRYDEARAALAADVRDLRDSFYREGQHRRTPSIVAELVAGFKCFMRFAREAGALTEVDVRTLEAECLEALEVAASAQTDPQQAEEPADKFLRLLGAAIASGQAHVAGLDGECPTADGHDVGRRWGWRCETIRRNFDEQRSWRPQGNCVGWVRDDDLYLDIDAAYAAAERMGRDQGDGQAVRPTTLRKRLKERGLLASTESGRSTSVRKSLAGAMRSVLHLRAAALCAPGETAHVTLAQPVLAVPVLTSLLGTPVAS